MNFKFGSLIRNFSLSLFANIVSTLISFLTIIVIPKVVGATDFGLFQLYSFYSSYVIFFRFGHADGIYLRLGGQEFNNINKKSLATQFWILTIFETIIALILIAFGFKFVENLDRLFILVIVGLSLTLIIPRTLLQVVLQSTNRISEYAISIIFERVIYGIFIFVLVFLETVNYRTLILIDFFSKTLSLFYVMLICKDIVFIRVNRLMIGIYEVIDNMKIGINLMLSSIVSMLIIGVIRFGIERRWSIETFGTVSLTLSVSNLLVGLVGALGIVIYPVLRKITSENLPKVFRITNVLLGFILFCSLLVYFPLSEILRQWLPKYSDGLKYMAILFPIYIYESKMSILIIPFYNSLRIEKLMLKINAISLFLSVFITMILVIYIGNLTLLVLLITVLVIYRSQVSGIVLMRILNLKIDNSIFYDLILTICFILSAWILPSLIGSLVYFLFLVIYTYSYRIKIAESIKVFINLRVDI